MLLISRGCTLSHDSISVAIGPFGLSMLFWMERRKKFKGAEIDWEALNAGNALG